MQGRQFRFRFFESFNDGGTANDSNWEDLRITFNVFTPPTPPVSVDLGNVSNGVYPATTLATIGAAAEVDWYCFNVTSAISALDIFGGFPAGNFDTEFGLYDSNGFLVTTNDDYAFPAAAWSRMGFGGGSGTDPDGEGPLAPFGTNSGHSAAILAPGTYYLAAGAFNTNFGASGFGAVSTSAALGEYSVNFIPTPGALALLGLGGIIAGRRRR